MQQYKSLFLSPFMLLPYVSHQHTLKTLKMKFVFVLKHYMNFKECKSKIAVVRFYPDRNHFLVCIHSRRSVHLWEISLRLEEIPLAFLVQQSTGYEFAWFSFVENLFISPVFPEVMFIALWNSRLTIICVHVTLKMSCCLASLKFSWETRSHFSYHICILYQALLSCILYMHAFYMYVSCNMPFFFRCFEDFVIFLPEVLL